MPLGIVSEEELLDEINRLNEPNKVNVEIVEQLRPGRTEGDNNVPDALRKIIGETSITEGRAVALDLARQFHVSPSSVSAYANGATSLATYNQPNESLKNHNDEVKMKIVSKARSKLLRAISHITDENLKETKPKDLAAIAKDMSAVVKNIEPPESNNPTSIGPTFLVYAPSIRKEQYYETIRVNE